MLKTLQDLRHEHEGIVVARPTFGITLFSNEPISKFSDGVLAAFARYREIVGDQALRFYSTATMRKHSKVTKRALGMLDAWFGPEAPPSEDYGIEYVDAEPSNAAPASRFVIFGVEDVPGHERSTASILRMALPPEWGTERPEDAFALTEELCGLIPFQSGQAGFAFELSRYFIEPANEFAVPMSMRHPGVDIHNQTGKEGNAVGIDGVRGVGWLTMLGDGLVEKLGGVPKLELCTITKVPGGIIIRAGKAPAMGDVNRKDDLPAYREAYAYVEPLARDVPERSPWFTFFRSRDAGDRTEAWYKRFA